MFLPSASAETAETSRVPGHTAAACLSLHLKPAGLLQLTSLQTAVVDHRSPSARAERRCAAHSGLVTTRPRQFCTPDITLAAHLLRIQFKIALLMYNALAGRCPEYINDIVAPVASNPGRKQLRSAARSDVIVAHCRTKFSSRTFSVAGPEVWNRLPQSVRSADTDRQFRRLLKTQYFQLHFGPN